MSSPEDVKSVAVSEHKSISTRAVVDHCVIVGPYLVYHVSRGVTYVDN